MPSGRARRVVDRAQQPRVAVDVADDLALVPDMVAGGDDVDAGRVELCADFVGQAEAVRGVLGVDDDEVERKVAAQRGQVFEYDVAARPADDIAADKNVHGVLLAGFAAARDLEHTGLGDDPVERLVVRAGNHPGKLQMG